MNGSVTYEGSTLLSGSINVNAGGNIEALNVQITENGTRTIEASSGVDGYNPITIETAIPIPEPVLDSISITENGTYTPPTGTDGYNDISVNVPQDTPNIQSLNTTISGNGVTIIHASDVNCDGFDPVIIRTEVPEPVLISKTITENGTYTPGVGTDGYNEVVVNVQSHTPVFIECCKNLELIDSNGINQGYKHLDVVLTDSHRYLILLYMQNQTSSPFGYIFTPNFIQFPTMEVYIQLQYSQFRIDIQSSQVKAYSSHNSGVKVTVLQIPDDYVASPF